jgi:hypothetical protein
MFILHGMLMLQKLLQKLLLLLLLLMLMQLQVPPLFQLQNLVERKNVMLQVLRRNIEKGHQWRLGRMQWGVITMALAAGVTMTQQNLWIAMMGKGGKMTLRVKI